MDAVDSNMTHKLLEASPSTLQQETDRHIPFSNNVYQFEEIRTRPRGLVGYDAYLGLAAKEYFTVCFVLIVGT